MLSKMILEEPIQAAVWECLNHYNYEDAIFIAERLWSEVDTDETLYLLATCYYRAGKKSQAYALLRKRTLGSSRTKFLCAKCCYDTGRFLDAELILIRREDLKEQSLEQAIYKEYDQEASFVLQLLARIYFKTERPAKGLIAFKASLSINPLLWSSYQEICSYDTQMNPEEIFCMEQFQKFNTVGPRLNIGPAVINVSMTNKTDEIVTCHTTSTPKIQPVPTEQTSKLCNNERSAVELRTYPFIRTTKENGFEVKYCFSPFASTFGIMPEEITQNETTFNRTEKTPLPPPRITAGYGEQKVLTQLQQHTDDDVITSRPVFSQYVNSNIILDKHPPEKSSQVIRKSSRVGSINYSVKENQEAYNKKTVVGKTSLIKSKYGRVIRNTKKMEESKLKNIEQSQSLVIPSVVVQSAHEQAINLQKKSLEGLFSLLKMIGKAYQYLCRYDCELATKCFDELPKNQKHSPTILSWIGKMYVEAHDYKTAVSYFSLLTEQEQAVIDGMEYYSTALWHLHKQKELSSLAQSLMKLDRLHPITWCVAGNLLSLAKEHDEAIKFFQRAIQLNPRFVYPYTLLGHEYVVIDDYDKALCAYRTATSVQPNHYNAWYGLGSLMAKEEKYTLAETYFKTALKLHPRNTVLLCHLALVENALKSPHKALETIDKALAIDPKHVLCKYHRASIWFKIGNYERALKELLELKELAPRESLVYYLMGEVHKKMNNPHLALMCFNWATDLDPKGTNSHVKESTSDPLMNSTFPNEFTAVPMPSPTGASTVVVVDRNSMIERQPTSSPNSTQNSSYFDTSS